MADLLAGRCRLCGRVTGADTGQPPYRCRCDRFDLLAARGGRLLAEYTGCESTGHYSEEIFRFDHPSGGRSYFCRPCWGDAWRAAGQPSQVLLDDAAHPAAERRERSEPTESSSKIDGGRSLTEDAP